MNVNLWGPDLWSLLHGLAGLYTQAKNNLHDDIDAIDIIFKELRILLPCIHCKKSYNEFYPHLNIRRQFSRGDGIKCVYDIHSLVDDKLDYQRLNKFISEYNLKLNEDDFKNAIKILSNRPSLQVVEKRWELSEGVPFREQSVWRILFSFILCLDQESLEDAHHRRESFEKFTKALQYILSKSLQYKILGQKLCSINISNLSSKQAFENIALARESIIKSNEDDIWINELWKVYIGNMPAGSCGTFTCV